MQRILLVTCILLALLFAAYKPSRAADGAAAQCARCHAGR
jgi:hypothetical protein